MRAPLPVETLVARQFSLAGCWRLDAAASLVLAGTAPDVPGVCAFVMEGFLHCCMREWECFRGMHGLRLIEGAEW